MSTHSAGRLSRITLALLAGGSLVLGAASSASALPPFTGGPVRPNQDFGALVNGHSHHATIAMACFGPIHPGQRSHPMGGQTLDVFRPEVLRVDGYTGQAASRIVTRFSDDPSAKVTFTRYGSKAIPTSLDLPCGGTGTVTFAPEPGSNMASPVVVDVSYQGQP